MRLNMLLVLFMTFVVWMTVTNEAHASQRIRVTWTEVKEDMNGNKIPPGRITYNSYGAKDNGFHVPVATNIKGNDHVVTLSEGCYSVYVTAYRADKGIESEPSNVVDFCTDDMDIEPEVPPVDASGSAPRIPALTIEKLYQ